MDKQIIVFQECQLLEKIQLQKNCAEILDLLH